MEKNNQTPKLEHVLRGHRSTVTSVAFSPSRPTSCFSALSKHSSVNKRKRLLLASGLSNGILTLWNVPESCDDNNGRDEVRAYQFLGHKGQINNVTFSPSGNLIASCSSDHTVRLWLPNANGDSVILKGHSASVRCIDFSRASYRRCSAKDQVSSLLLTCSDDKTVKVWELPHKKFKCSLLGHANWVRCCKFSPDTESMAASSSDDKTVKIWDVVRGCALNTYSDFGSRGSGSSAAANGSGVNVIDFHNYGSVLASGASDGSIRMYDIRSDVIIQHYPHAAAPGSGITSLSFHPSGNYLLSSSDTGDVKMWDIRVGRLLHSVMKQENNTNSNTNRGTGSANVVSSCSTFSHDGIYLASNCSAEDYSNSDRNVKIWSMESLINNSGGKEQNQNPDATKVQISKGGGRVANREKQTFDRRNNKRPATAPTRKITTTTDAKEEVTVIESLAGEDVVYVDDINDIISIPKDESNHMVHQDVEQTSGISFRKDDRSDKYYEKEKLPEMLAATLDHIVGQLDVLTKTVTMLDKRLSIQEDTLAQILAEKTQTKLLHENGISPSSHSFEEALNTLAKSEKDATTTTDSASNFNDDHVPKSVEVDKEYIAERVRLALSNIMSDDSTFLVDSGNVIY